jgi:hypothetical protein
MPAKKFKQVRNIESVRDGLTAVESQLIDGQASDAKYQLDRAWF